MKDEAESIPATMAWEVASLTATVAVAAEDAESRKVGNEREGGGNGNERGSGGCGGRRIEKGGE